MAVKRYRKGWTGLSALVGALASAVLLSLVAAPKAHAQSSANRLNASDLLGGELSVRSVPALAVQSSVELAQASSTTSSDTFAPLSDEDIRQQLLLEPRSSSATRSRPRPVPASSFLTPTAYGADWGDAYIGLAQVTAGNESFFDGSAAIGIGFGDAVKNVGVETS